MSKRGEGGGVRNKEKDGGELDKFVVIEVGSVIGIEKSKRNVKDVAGGKKGCCQGVSRTHSALLLPLHMKLQRETREASLDRSCSAL